MSKDITMLTLAKIRLDGGTQSRAEIDSLVVAEYAEYIEAGSKFPSVIVFYDGEHHWLADGFHRVKAHLQLKRKFIEADIRQGTRRDAILFSVGANHKVGLRRTREDLHRAVDMLLRDEEWSRWSNAEIARRCNVSGPLVGTRRKVMEREAAQNTSVPEQPTERKVERNGTTYSVETGGMRGPGRREGASLSDLTMRPTMAEEEAGARPAPRGRTYLLEEEEEPEEIEDADIGLGELPDGELEDSTDRAGRLEQAGRSLRKLARQSIQGGVDAEWVRAAAAEWVRRIEQAGQG